MKNVSKDLLKRENEIRVSGKCRFFTSICQRRVNRILDSSWSFSLDLNLEHVHKPSKANWILIQRRLVGVIKNILFVGRQYIDA